MLRQLLTAAVLLAGPAWLAGCRACSSCYDYSRPVADCECGTCGCGRAGSAFCNGCGPTAESCDCAPGGECTTCH